MGTLAFNPLPGRQPEQPHVNTPECCCPKCLGLKCLERPRFFAGQLLTEAELNSLEAYVVEKNKLHNRYLHGPGVVCGLYVSCHDCDGRVVVNPGYAIDPCGNDVIVCEPVVFDVIKAIDECCGGRRRAKRDCDPYRPPSDDACKGGEQKWCITIEYVEREARPVQALRNEACCDCCASGKACNCGSKSGGGGCGCGGSKGGSDCGCGGKGAKSNGNGARHNGSKSAASCRVPPMRQPSVTECEPSRILETFRLCVVEDPGDCAERLRANSLAERMLACVTELNQYIASKFNGQNIASVIAIAHNPATTPAQLFELCCKLRKALLDLLDHASFLTHCNLKVPGCSPPPPGDATGAGGALGQWRADTVAAIDDMLAILGIYLRDCLCAAMLPPCGDNPCEGRLILACVTVRDGKVIDICNFSCRQFAGAFPTLSYWFSIFPLIQTILNQLARVCCRPFERTSDQDPNGSVVVKLADGNLAVPMQLQANVQEQLKRFSFDSFAAPFLKPGAVNLPALVGLSAEQVMATLRQADVSFIERRVETSAQVPPPRDLTGNLFAGTGDRVVIYRAGDKVVGFSPFDDRLQLDDAHAQLAALRADVEELKARLNQ